MQFIEWMEWMKKVIYLVELMFIWLIVKCDFAKIVSNGTYHVVVPSKSKSKIASRTENWFFKC